MCGGDEGKEKSIGELNGEKGLAVVVFISFQRQPPITDPSSTLNPIISLLPTVILFLLLAHSSLSTPSPCPFEGREGRDQGREENCRWEKRRRDQEEDIKKEREVFPSVIILLTSESLSGFSARR